MYTTSIYILFSALSMTCTVNSTLQYLFIRDNKLVELGIEATKKYICI